VTATIAPPATDIAFTVEPSPFTRATEQVAHHVPQRPSVPTLAGLLLDVADGTLTASAFDYEVAASVHVDVVGDSDGRALVSGRLLAQLVKTFPDKPVTARVDGTQLAITCGAVKVRLPLMPAEEYPALPAVPPTVGTVDAETFKTVVEQVAVAAGTEDAVPVLTGIHLHLTGTAITLLASDRYRAATVTVPWQPADPSIDATLLVPAKVLVAAVKDATGSLTVSLDGDYLAGFATDRRSITTRLLASDPPYPQKTLDGFFTAAAAGTAAQIRTADLATAVHRAQLVVAKTAPAVLVFTGGHRIRPPGGQSPRRARLRRAVRAAGQRAGRGRAAGRRLRAGGMRPQRARCRRAGDDRGRCLTRPGSERFRPTAPPPTHLHIEP
jgi:DNA polymerase-3 subunit beta